MDDPQRRPSRRPVPVWLLGLCLALMCAACAINSALVALAVPSLAQYGVIGLMIAGVVGAVVGIAPGLWLARRIADGIAEEP